MVALASPPAGTFDREGDGDMGAKRNGWRAAAAVIAVLATTFVGCGSHHAAAAFPESWPPLIESASVEAPAPATRNIVLVTVDGARWQEIFEGVDPELARDAGMGSVAVTTADALLPNIYDRLLPRGVAEGAPRYSAPMIASGPAYLSLPGYLELLHGKPSATCRANTCAAAREPSIADEIRALPDVKQDDVAVISSWETIDRAATNDASKIVISTGRHHGETRDRLRVDDRAAALLDEAAGSGASPGSDDYRADRFTAALALRYLEARHPRFLFVGLGDTDEYAHAGDYRAYLNSLRATDAFLGDVLDVLAKSGSYGENTTILVTCDHGRARNFRDHGRERPESSRVWLLASGGSIPPHGYARDLAVWRLADVAPTIRALLDMPRDESERAGTPIASLLEDDETRLREARR